jgi:hypothetical protein
MQTVPRGAPDLMAEDSSSLHHVRSWYGLDAELAVEGRLWHLVRIGRMRLVHPALINLVLRAGLPIEDRLRLSYLHEFGHLQTLPVALAHAAALLWAGRGRMGWIGWLEAMTVAHQATWELASEAYVAVSGWSDYRATYRRHPNPLSLGFWVVMAGLSFGLTWLLVRRRDSSEA